MRFTLLWDLCIRLVFGGLGGCLLYMLIIRYVSYCHTDLRNASQSGTAGNEKQPRLLFVGVMTAAHFLDTRALSVYQTWGQKVPGKEWTVPRNSVD